MELHKVSKTDAENIELILNFLNEDPQHGIWFSDDRDQFKYLNEGIIAYYKHILEGLPIPIVFFNMEYELINPMPYLNEYMKGGGFIADWERNLTQYNREQADKDLQRKQATADIRAADAAEQSAKYAKWSLWAAIGAAIISMIAIALQIVR